MAKSTVSAAPVVARTQTGPFDLPLDGKVTVANPNAKNPGTKGGARFALYRNGQTVQQYLDASTKAGNRLALAKADVMWDFNHGFVTVAGAKIAPLGAPARGRGAQAEVKPAPKAAAKPKTKAVHATA